MSSIDGEPAVLPEHPQTKGLPSMPRRAYAIIIAGFFTVGIAYGIRYGYGMLLPEMLPALGISKIQAGTIFAIYFIVYTVCTPILGTLSDFYNYRFILTLFTAVLAGGALLMSLASNFILACLFFSLAGLGHAACWAPVTALVSKWVPDNRRGTALSFVTMGVGLGIPLWGFMLPKIVDRWNWPAGWVAMGLFALAVAVLNALMVRNPAGMERPKTAVHSQIALMLSTYGELLKNKAFWTIGLAYLLIGFNVLVPFTFLPVYSREVLDLAYATSTRFPAFIAIFGIAGQLTLGTLSDGMGRIRVLMICGSIMGLACLGMVYFNTPWLLFATTAFYGLGYGAVWPVYAAAASDYFPKSKTGSVVGLWTVYLGAGSIVSPVICGWTIDITGGYGWTFVLGLLSGILSVLLLIFVPKPTTVK
jgi:MFS family permease